MRPGTAIEISKAVTKAMNTHLPFPIDRLRGAAIISEEAGEIMKDALEYTRPGRASEEILRQMRREILDTAAACVLMLESIDDYMVKEHMRVKGIGE